MSKARVLVVAVALAVLAMAPANAAPGADVTVSVPGASVTLLPFAMPAEGQCVNVRARVSLADTDDWKRIQVSINDLVRTSIAYENWSPKQVRKAPRGILPLKVCAKSWYNRVYAEWMGPAAAQMSPLLPATQYEVWLVMTKRSGEKVPARTTMTTPG